jgi:chemotaxis regulatin CheY-phosphate phosphatase CheZ
VPGSGRGLWKQSRAEIANQVSSFYRLVQSSLVDVGIQRNVTRIAQYFSDFSDREPIAQ